mmetsp:Transcript_203/g.280  ORF Transcript_203/g.280 Transcript_203/m.280 type:complete len:91 (+) Transcript_203:1163-1435(+)
MMVQKRRRKRGFLRERAAIRVGWLKFKYVKVCDRSEIAPNDFDRFKADFLVDIFPSECGASFPMHGAFESKKLVLRILRNSEAWVMFNVQ